MRYEAIAMQASSDQLDELINASSSLEPHALVASLLRASPGLALKARDALAIRNKAALTHALGQIMSDLGVAIQPRLQAAWLLKDLCAVESWPYLKQVIVDPATPPELGLSALDATERLTFAGLLRDSDVTSLERWATRLDPSLKIWVSILSNLETSSSIALLQRYALDSTRLQVVLDDLRDRPNPWIDSLLAELEQHHGKGQANVSATIERRSYIQQRERWRNTTNPVSATDVQLLWQHRDLGYLHKLSEEGRLTAEAMSTALALDEQGLSPSQRKLMRRIKRLLSSPAGNR